MVPDVSNKASTPGQSGGSEDTWIAEVSHELRLPLANIKLLVETLLDGALEEPETARRMLTRTSEEVTRLQNLVSDLLSHEKVSINRAEAGRASVSALSAINQALETASPLALAKGVAIKVETTPEVVYFADADQMHQVLVNLLENAIKFTAEGGTVTVRASRDPLVLEVEDTGIGINEAEIPKIFQRFYRVDRSKTRGSTGLGLTIVKHIVELHGAKISVTSKEGQGSRFTILFPSL